MIRVLINAAALWVAVALLDGIEFAGSPLELLGIALALGVVNVIVRPVLKLLSLPLLVLTLGLFLLVINAVMLTLVIWFAGAVGIELTTDGFWWTLAAAFVVSVVSWGIETLLGR